jgi:hypothetical protein
MMPVVVGEQFDVIRAPAFREWCFASDPCSGEERRRTLAPISEWDKRLRLLEGRLMAWNATYRMRLSPFS